MNFSYCFEATEEELLKFLQLVDKDFPVPLSEKTELTLLSSKFFNLGDVIIARDSNNDIAGIVAGYLKNGQNGLGYISVVAVKKEYRGLGLSKQMLSRYLLYCNDNCETIDAIHIYTTTDNIYALEVYRSLGFVDYYLDCEPRPTDVHLIYYLRRPAMKSQV